MPALILFPAVIPHQYCHITSILSIKYTLDFYQRRVKRFWIPSLCVCVVDVLQAGFYKHILPCFELKLYKRHISIETICHTPTNLTCLLLSGVLSCVWKKKKKWNCCTGEKYHFNTPCWWICTHTSCCLCNQRCCKAVIQSALSPSEGWRTTYSLWLNDHPHGQADRHTVRQTGRKHCLIK